MDVVYLSWLVTPISWPLLFSGSFRKNRRYIWEKRFSLRDITFTVGSLLAAIVLISSVIVVMRVLQGWAVPWSLGLV